MGDKLQSDNCIFTMPTMWKSISNIRHLQFRDTEFQQTEGANRLPSGATIITRNQKDSKLGIDWKYGTLYYIHFIVSI